jgi:hypothetical protein
MRNDFAIFILTNGRPDSVHSYDALVRQDYGGKVYIIIDNEDPTADEYRKRFGDKVIVFDKKKVAAQTDSGDNFDGLCAILYARNACHEIALGLGVKYFMELDDDYMGFYYRLGTDQKYSFKQIKNLDSVLSLLVGFFESIPAKAIAIAQGGDFMGGEGCTNWIEGFGLMRKCMNTFICSTDRPFKFSGRMNEDVTNYVCFASKGNLFLTIPNVSINQLATQSGKGGMTDVYLESGTYVKSFYSIMYSPSCVKIRTMGNKNRRIHHSVSWAHAVPVILDEKYRKA